MSKYIKLEDAINVYREKHILVNGVAIGVRHPTPEENITALSELPTIEVSEDCISREWVKGICEMMLDEEMLEHMLGYIEDAPSVVPKERINNGQF